MSENIRNTRSKRVPKDKKILVWMDGDTYTKLVHEARENRRSNPDQVRFVIDEYYKKEG